jgi:hypothetical protein
VSTLSRDSHGIKNRLSDASLSRNSANVAVRLSGFICTGREIRSNSSYPEAHKVSFMKMLAIVLLHGSEESHAAS